MAMKRRVSQLKPGDRIRLFDMDITLDEVHHFDAIPAGGGAHFPACSLLIFGEQSVSLEPHERVTLCRVN